jgi:hypothetical protein
MNEGTGSNKYPYLCVSAFLLDSMESYLTDLLYRSDLRLSVNQIPAGRQ